MKQGEGAIPLDADSSPAESRRPAAVVRRGSGLGANLVDGDPDLVRRASGGSPELGCDGEGVGRRGGPVRGSTGGRWLGW
jgi:hypothetical protein